VGVLLDPEVLDWLRSKREGHLARIGQDRRGRAEGIF
jgi:hypothetical protein